MNTSVRKLLIITPFFTATFLLTILFSFGVLAPAHAAFLGSHTIEHLGFTSLPGEDIEIVPFYGDAVPDMMGSTTYSPFGTITVDVSQIGVDMQVSATGSEFSGAETFLTNGNSDLVGDILWVGGSGLSSGFAENFVLSGPGFDGTDFGSKVIDIDTMTLTITGFSQTVVGAGFINNLQYEVVYEGTLVPLPASVWLLSAGIFSVFGMRWKRTTLTARGF